MLDDMTERIARRMGLVAEQEASGRVTGRYGPEDRTTAHVTLHRADSMIVLRFYEGDRLSDSDLDLQWYTDGRIHCCTRVIPTDTRPLCGVNAVVQQVDAITDGALRRGLRQPSANRINPKLVAWLAAAPAIQPGLIASVSQSTPLRPSSPRIGRG